VVAVRDEVRITSGMRFGLAPVARMIRVTAGGSERIKLPIFPVMWPGALWLTK
jgi:hypothetical protein